MPTSRTILLNQNDIPLEDLETQVLLNQLHSGFKIPCSNSYHLEEFERLEELYLAINQGNYPIILELMKNPLFDARLLRLRLGIRDTNMKISPDEFRSIMILSYFQALNLNLTIKNFFDYENNDFKVSFIGNKWMDELQFKEAGPQPRLDLIDKLSKADLSFIENSILVVKLSEIYLVGICLIYLDFKLSNNKVFEASQKELAPLFNYFINQESSLELGNIAIIPKLKEINATNCQNELFKLHKLFTEMHPELLIFTASIHNGIKHMAAVMVDGAFCLLIGSSSLFQMYVNVSNPKNTIRYMDSLGVISPQTLEYFLGKGIRVGNLFMRGIVNPKKGHEMMAVPAFFQLHDWLYHYYLMKQLDPQIREECLRINGVLRVYTSSKSTSTLTRAMWKFTDQDIYWYNNIPFHGLFINAFKINGTKHYSPERYKVLVHMIVYPLAWPSYAKDSQSIIKALAKIQEGMRLRDEIVKLIQQDTKEFFRKTKSIEKTAVLIYLKYELGMPEEAHHLASISKTYPAYDWVKWQKAPSPDNYEYPLLRIAGQTYDLSPARSGFYWVSQFSELNLTAIEYKNVFIFVESEQTFLYFNADGKGGGIQIFNMELFKKHLIQLMGKKKFKSLKYDDIQELTSMTSFSNYLNERSTLLSALDILFHDRLAPPTLDYWHSELLSLLMPVLDQDNIDVKLLLSLINEVNLNIINNKLKKSVKKPEYLFEEILKILPRLHTLFANKLIAIISQWHNNYMLTLMRYSVIDLMDKMHYAMNTDELATARPVISTARRFNLFQYSKARTGYMQANLLINTIYREIKDISNATVCAQKIVTVLRSKSAIASGLQKQIDKFPQLQCFLLEQEQLLITSSACIKP